MKTKNLKRLMRHDIERKYQYTSPTDGPYLNLAIAIINDCKKEIETTNSKTRKKLCYDTMYWLLDIFHA